MFKENVNIREYTIAQFIFEMTTYVNIFYYMYTYLFVEFQSTIQQLLLHQKRTVGLCLGGQLMRAHSHTNHSARTLRFYGYWI